MEANIQVLELLVSGSLIALARIRKSKLMEGRIFETNGNIEDKGDVIKV